MSRRIFKNKSGMYICNQCGQLFKTLEQGERHFDELHVHQTGFTDRNWFKGRVKKDERHN